MKIEGRCCLQDSSFSCGMGLERESMEKVVSGSCGSICFRGLFVATTSQIVFFPYFFFKSVIDLCF